MALVTVAITGHVLAPDGSAPTSGRLVVKLSQPGSALDGTESVRVATEVTEDLGAGGAVSFALAPNDTITPSGTHYLATFVVQLASGRRVQWAEKWQLTSDDLALDIGAVPRIDAVPGVALSNVVPDSVAAAILASEAAAAISAGEALGAAAAAEAGRVAAETARDQAQNASGTYDSTTAGLAATASGGYFYVPSGDGGLIRYLDNAGVAVEVGRVAAGAVVEELVAAVPPRSADTSSNLDYAADAAGRVYRYTDSAGRLWLVGRTQSLQTRLSEIDGITSQADTPSAQWYVADAAGRIVAQIDGVGGLVLPGRSESVQATVDRVETQADQLYRGSGAVVLPATFTPMGKALRGEERYVWAGMPAALRPNQSQVTAYPFEWSSQDLVIPSMMRRRKGTVITNPNRADRIVWGAEESITVTGTPAGFFDNADTAQRRQLRDGAHMFDRKTGLYWYADSGITDTPSGWRSAGVPLFSSPDGLAWTYVTEVIPYTNDRFTHRCWTPEWFVDQDGTLYLQISYQAMLGPSENWAPLFVRCNAPDDMSSWTTVGLATGTAFPTTSGGAVSNSDSFAFQRHGVYYSVWKETSFTGGSHLYGRMGIAWSTSLLGPYNSGHAFSTQAAEQMRGEGICVIELPPGSTYRYRLLWDNYLGLSYSGRTAQHMCCETNDFTTFTTPMPTGYDTNAATIYQRNSAFAIGY